MLKKNKFPIYNDGVILICREKEKKSSFNAKLNSTSMDDVDVIYKLDFQEMSKRQEDIEFAHSLSFSLDLKIKTRYVKGIDNKCKAVYDNRLYDIKHIDPTRTELFLYLQGGRRIDT